MELKQVIIQGGEALVAEVPAPHVGEKNILVSVDNSCISSGTEVSGLANSGMPLYQRALKQPSNVLLALKMVQEQGLARTVKQIKGVLGSGSATGYSAAGTIIEIGVDVEGFSIGDRVACAGADIANHAEIIDVPVNLAVKIPENVSTEDASTVTLGCIALQGVRRASPTLGETIVVMGLGILGQITCQLLKENGCRVIGIDLNPMRNKMALANGLDHAFCPTDEDCVAEVLLITEGIGADAVIITASGQSNEIVSSSMNLCRKKGRVVLVGDVGLNLKREDFYVKELDFLISTSYGPGRYDPYYEQQGNDYPIGYVRWTENRNMQAYLSGLSKQSLSLENLKSDLVDIDQVGEVYAQLKENSRKGLVHIISYPSRECSTSRLQKMLNKSVPVGKISVGLVGAGGFAQGMILPTLVKLRKYYHLDTIVGRSGANAVSVARQFEVANASTDLSETLENESIQLVVISTRHNLHAEMVLKALKAGKHVFVEKPLAINEAELNEIESFIEMSDSSPMLMTGFNRRYSPPTQVIKKLLDKRTSPVMITYQMNAGYLDLDHWTHGVEGGGRNIGEACHIYDLFNYLVGGDVNTVSAAAVNTASKRWTKNDNFNVTISYANGSVCNLIYTALGNKNHPKEMMSLFFDQKVITMTDYMSVVEAGKKQPLWISRLAQKGHFEEFRELASILQKQDEQYEYPIDLQDQFQAMKIAFEVENTLNR